MALGLCRKSLTCAPASIFVILETPSASRRDTEAELHSNVFSCNTPDLQAFENVFEDTSDLANRQRQVTRQLTHACCFCQDNYSRQRRDLH